MNALLTDPFKSSRAAWLDAGFKGNTMAAAAGCVMWCLWSSSTVRACLDLLVPWIHCYVDNQDSSGRQVCCDVSLHGPFYAACQAVFYTLIFRHRAILEANMKKGARVGLLEPSNDPRRARLVVTSCVGSPCLCVRSGVPAELEPGAGGSVSAEPAQSVPASSHQHVCCHHQVHQEDFTLNPSLTSLKI